MITAKELAEVVLQITDQQILNRVEAVIAEPEIKDLIDKISKDRNNSFSAQDQNVIRTAVLEAPGSLKDKVNFLNTCLNVGYIDMGKLLRESTGKVVNLVQHVGTKADPVFKYVTEKLAGRGGGGFNLGSGAAVGPGEGWFILVAKGVTKGRVGDLMFNNEDVELKANAARWHSARAQYKSVADSYKVAFKYLTDRGMSASFEEFKRAADFRSTNFPTEGKVKSLGISVSDFTNAFAEGFAHVLPKEADVSFLRENWVGNSNKFRASYAAAISSAYQAADKWAFITQFDYQKKTVVSCTSGKSVYDSIIKGSLKSSPTPDRNFFGGSDSRSMSPNFDVGR